MNLCYFRKCLSLLSQARQTRRQERSCRPEVEILEDRALPSNISLANGELRLSGSPAKDVFTVKRSNDLLVATIDASAGDGYSSSARVPVGKVSSIRIDGTGGDLEGRGGDDEVDLDSIQALIPVYIKLGIGTKPHTDSFATVLLAADNGDLGNLFGSVVDIWGVSVPHHYVHTSLIAQDFGPKLQPQSYTLTEYSLTRSGSGTVYFPPLTHVELNTGGSKNTIRVEQSPGDDFARPGPAAVVRMSPGDLTTLDRELDGTLQVIGYKNTGTLAVEDSGDSFDTIPVTSTSIQLKRGQANYSGMADVAVHVSWGTTVTVTGTFPCAVDLFGDNSNFTLDGTGSSTVRIVGNFNSQSLSALSIQNNGDSTWHITGPDSGDVNGCISFQGVSHWLGDAATHRFIFAEGAWDRDYAETKGGAIILDFSDYEVPVVVDLSQRLPFATAFAPTEDLALFVTGKVTEVIGGSGDDTLTGDDTPNQILRGGPGNDVIRGGAGPAVLCGNDGNDTLYAGSGRNILIGGTGADHLYGGTGDDILIGGYTSYDGTFAVVLANQATNIVPGGSEPALLALLAEWANPNETYAQRVANLSYGVGRFLNLPNGMIALNSSTIYQDYATDRLYGGGGSNWYWRDPAYLEWMNGQWVYVVGDLQFT